MLLSIVRIIAVIAIGLYAGIILGDRIGASYSRPALEPSAFVQFQQIQHLHFKTVLAPLIIIAVVASVVALGGQRGRFTLQVIALGLRAR